MRRLISSTALAVSCLVALMSWSIATAQDDASGTWTAAKKRPSEAKATDELAYRPSTEYSEPQPAPVVERRKPVAAAARRVVAESSIESPVDSDADAATSDEDGAEESANLVAKRPAKPPRKLVVPASARPLPPVRPLAASGKLVRNPRATSAADALLLVDRTGKPRCVVAADEGLSRYVDQFVRVAGTAEMARGGQLPTLSVEQVSSVASNRPAARVDHRVTPTAAAQSARNREPAMLRNLPYPDRVFKNTSAQVDSHAPEASEDVPPPVRTKPAPIDLDEGESAKVPQRAAPGPAEKQTTRAKPKTSMPQPEAIDAGEGQPDGEGYYFPPELGGQDDEGVVYGDGQPMVVQGPYGRRYPVRRVGWALLNNIHGGWVRADYLLWSTESMYVPPLVTTSPAGTPRATAGVLGETGASVLFGDTDEFGDSRSGGRLQAGVWCDPCHVWGFGGDFLALEDADIAYSASSPGSPILARPFFDALNGQETSQLVAFPNLISGDISVDASTRFQAAGVHLRLNACRDSFSCDTCATCEDGDNAWESEWRTSGLPGADFNCNRASYRLDLIGGYRYLRLDDQLSIHEDLTSLDTSAPGTFDITDSFDAENRFHGGEFGMLFEVQRRRWSLELLTKIALGTTQEVVTIAGSTTTDEGGDVITENGGLLAQRTNIGRHEHNNFTAVPELGVTLGYQLTQHVRVNVGYTMIYWSRVARAGDQIDLDVNPNLIPPEADPFSGPERPRFQLVESDFWAHGLNVGLDCRW